MSPSLVRLAARVHELLLRPGYLDAARRLAEACLADREQGHVDRLQFPAHPDLSLYDVERRERERSLAGPPSLTPGQVALALAALYDVGCPHVPEKVIVIPASTLEFDDNGRVTGDYPRAVRWSEIRKQVDGLGDYALDWFSPLLGSFERFLSESVPPADDDLPDAAERPWESAVSQLLRFLRLHGCRDYLPEMLVRELETPVPLNMPQRDRAEAEAGALAHCIDWLYWIKNEPPLYLADEGSDELQGLVDAAIESVRKTRPRLAVHLNDIDRRTEEEKARQKARRGRAAGVDVEEGSAGHKPPPAPPVGEPPAGSIRKDGANWVIEFGPERGSFPVKDYGAIATLAKLLAQPRHVRSLDELTDAALELLSMPETRDVAMDSTALAAAKRRYDELQQERVPDDPIAEQEHREELARLATTVRKALAPGGRKKKLGSSDRERAWDSLRKNLCRLWPRLKRGGMPRLAEHLEGTIEFNRPTITCLPPSGTAAWSVPE
jgi:hypothetical protein